VSCTRPLPTSLWSFHQPAEQACNHNSRHALELVSARTAFGAVLRRGRFMSCDLEFAMAVTPWSLICEGHF
jgi:hypothetical protein